MANQGKNHKGYVLIGVADKEEDAAKIRHITGKNNVIFKNFHITGLEHDLIFFRQKP